jgi:hypothetical protein
MEICDQLSNYRHPRLHFEPSRLHFEPPRLNCERQRPPWLHFKPLQVMNFGYDADPDSASQNNTDLDPASHNNADQDPHCLAIFHAQNSRKLPMPAARVPHI